MDGKKDRVCQNGFICAHKLDKGKSSLRPHQEKVNRQIFLDSGRVCREPAPTRANDTFTRRCRVADSLLRLDMP